MAERSLLEMTDEEVLEWIRVTNEQRTKAIEEKAVARIKKETTASLTRKITNRIKDEASAMLLGEGDES